jgi:hypothetical protein
MDSTGVWSELVTVLAIAPGKGVKLQVLFYDFRLSVPSQLGSNTIATLNCGHPGKPWTVDTPTYSTLVK